MEYLPPCPIDDLFDFSSDIGEAAGEEENDDKTKVLPLSPFLHSKRVAAVNSSLSSSFPGFVEEEELEWISNKDAFPMVESFADFLPNQNPLAAPTLQITAPATSTANHRSPVSVLENSSSTSLNSSGSCNHSNNNNSITGAVTALSGLMLSISSTLKAPGRPRTNRCRKKRRDLSEWLQHNYGFITTQKGGPGKQRAASTKLCSTLGRKCQHCQAEKTPQWRAGPMGPKTLCNACGVRYKSGRLVPEYRPASSPTFSSEVHSNSHRKIVEMRKRCPGTTMMMKMETGLEPLGSG